MKENCQNILKKKKENTEKTTDSAKTLLLFFCLSVSSICLGIWFFGKEVQFYDLHRLLHFYWFSTKCMGKLIQPSDWKFCHTRFKKENRKKKKKRKKRNDPLCELKRNLDLGTGGTFRHVCTPFFPIRNGLLDLSFFCCYLGWVPSVKGWGGLHLVFFFVYFLI